MLEIASVLLISNGTAKTKLEIMAFVLWRVYENLECSNVPYFLRNTFMLRIDGLN